MIDAAGGISSSPVHEMALKIIDAAGAGGSVLDFGAGLGEFTMRILRSARFQSICAADALARNPNLDASIRWVQTDLNLPLDLPEKFDTVISTEVIEHLENPRATFRTFASLLKPGGTLVLTMPNQESVRSFVALVFGGHFSAFRGPTYPAHITALLRLDLERICEETGFTAPIFFYSDHGAIPGRPRWRWQSALGPWVRGRLFSDNIGMYARRR